MNFSKNIFFGRCCLFVLTTLFLLYPNIVLADQDSTIINRYMRFLQQGVTPPRFIDLAREYAEKAGYRPGNTLKRLKAGDRLYFIHRNRSMVLVHIGRKPLEDGVRIAVGHIDAPHIHLKARPLYEREGFVLLQTRYYGGIKRYQWVSIPLALVGEIATTDGRRIKVDLGLKSGDPVLTLPDLAPHVDRPYRSRQARDVIQGEELDPILDLENRDSKNDAVNQWLQSLGNLTRNDLVSADLDIIPALPPRYVGLSKKLLGAYGQDDRSGSFTSLQGLLELNSIPEYTAIVMLVDLEEVGSGHNVGARSRYFTDLLYTLLNKQNHEASETEFARMLLKSQVLSVDATTGIHPIFPSVQESGNAARLGKGVVVKLYGEGFNAHPDIIAWIRSILERHHLPWQTHMYKVDVGGGGTVGGFFAQRGMEVIDVGVPLLGMHGTWEVSAVDDILAMTRFIRAFFETEDSPRYEVALP